MIAGISLGYQLPINPLQILWINVVTEGIVIINLIMDPPMGDEMQAPPTRVEDPILPKSALRRMALITPFIGLLLLGYFTHAVSSGLPLVVAQTQTFTLLAFCAFFNVVNARSERGTVFSKATLTNGFLWLGIAVALLLQLAVLYTPFLQELFHTTALSGPLLLKLFALGSLTLWVDELRKLTIKIFI